MSNEAAEEAIRFARRTTYARGLRAGMEACYHYARLVARLVCREPR